MGLLDSVANHFQYPNPADYDPLLSPQPEVEVPTAYENYEHILGRMVTAGEIDAPEMIIALDAFADGEGLELPIDRQVGQMYDIPNSIVLADE